MDSMWFFKLVLFLFSLPQLLQMNIPVWEFFSIYSSKTTRSVNNRLREKWILGPLEVGLHMLSHVVAVIVGQSLSTDATTEYAFFVSVNHWLDKGIHTCEIDWVKGGCSDTVFLLEGMLVVYIRFVNCWIMYGATIASFKWLLTACHFTLMSDWHVSFDVVPHMVSCSHDFLAHSASEFNCPIVVFFLGHHTIDCSI